MKTFDYGLAPDGINEMINYARLAGTMKTALKLKLFTALAKPMTLEALAGKTGIDAQMLAYMLDVLEKFGYVRKEGGGYVDTQVSAQYLDKRSVAYLGDDILDRVETEDLLLSFIEGLPESPNIDKRYWTKTRLRNIQATSMLGAVQHTVSAMDLAGRKRMLDVGGGHGLYSIFLAKRFKGLESTVVELPKVAEVAAENVKRYHAEDAVKVIPLDYHDYRPEERFDVVLLSNVLGDPEEMRWLLNRSIELLEPGGVAIVRNFIADEEGDTWASLTVMERYSRTGHKGKKTSDIKNAMKEAGYKKIKEIDRRESVVILRGQKP